MILVYVWHSLLRRLSAFMLQTVEIPRKMLYHMSSRTHANLTNRGDERLSHEAFRKEIQKHNCSEVFCVDSYYRILSFLGSSGGTAVG